MTTRNRLLAVGCAATLVAGSLFLASAPATAAPDSPSCVSSRAALGAAIDSATVDVGLAYDLKASLADIDQAGVELEAAWLAAEQEAEDEFAAFDEALDAFFLAEEAMVDAQVGLEQAQADYDDATEEQEEAAAALASLQADYDMAVQAFNAADQSLLDAERAVDDALFTEAVIEAEDNLFAAIERIEAILLALDGEGTAPEQVEALANAVIESCVAAGAGNATPPAANTVITPANDTAIAGATVTNGAVSTNRGLNVQSAAVEESASSQQVMASGALLAAIMACSVLVVVRLRRKTGSGS